MNQPIRTADIAEIDGWDSPSARRAIEIRAVVHVLWVRKWALILSFALCMGVAHLILQSIEKRYTASAEVMLNNRETNVVDIERVVSDLGGHDVSANEQRVLTSQRLLQQVVDRLRLDRDPEFNAALRPRSFLVAWRASAMAALARGPFSAVFDAPEDVVDTAFEQERERLGILESFREALEIDGVPFTRSITISVTSTDPAKAALIANTLADLYIVDQLETKFDATRRASAWLNERIGELKHKVETAEAAVEAFKAEQAIGDGQGSDLTAQQIAELNSELINARARAAEAKARFDQVQRRVQTGGYGAAADVVSSQLIVTLRTELAELVRRAAELSTRYGEKHPKMIDVRAQIADARVAIGREIRKTVEGLRNDVAVARAREAALEQSLTDLEDKSVALSRSSVALRQLEREAEADRLIYENFLNRFRETTEQEDLQVADARLLSVATPPLTPSKPRTKKILLIAAALGLALGLGLVVLLEMLSNTFRAVAEVGERTGLPVLAALPEYRRRRKRRQVLDYVREKPNSALAEAARALRTALFLSNIDRPPQVVMVTSSVPEEGKSTTCLLLAQMSAQANRRAIIVDCDIRRPTLQKTFPVALSTGLISVLDGSSTLDNAIVTDPESGLDFLPVLHPLPQAADILSSERFVALIGELRERYDLVLLDTAPTLLVSDAVAIGKLADAALYAVRWSHTPREAVMQGIERLSELGIRIAGCVVTLVDRHREGRYAYVNYGYYAGSDIYYTN